jgi:hypothetical protein
MQSTSPDTFTPLYDGIIQQHGVLTAAVYGLIWRYCQMRDGVCRASIATMAAHINVSLPTITRHIDILLTAGYVNDLTPNVRNRPHTYAINTTATGLPQITNFVEEEANTNQFSSPNDGSEIVSGTKEVVTGGTKEIGSATKEISTKGTKIISSTATKISTRYKNSLQSGRKKRVMNQTLLRDSFKKQREETLNAKKIWSQVYDMLAREMTHADLLTWLNPARPLAWNGQTLEIAVANDFTRQWLYSHLGTTIKNFLRGLTGTEARLEFKILPPE